MSRSFAPLLLLSLCLLALTRGVARAADDAWVVQNHQARAAIVLPEDAEENEKLAATELVEHVRAMTRAELLVGTKPVAGMTSIFLGRAADAPLEALVRAQSTDPFAFAIEQTSTAIHIRGLSDQGTLCGVYDLLESWGVRWFYPGAWGTVIPQVDELRLPLGRRVQFPSFAARWTSSGRYRTQFSEEGVWCRRVRMGGPNFPSAHGIPLGRNVTVQTDPELFATVHGKRNGKQVCVSHPRVLELAVEQTRAVFRKNPERMWIGMGPNDGSGFCECTSCQALDSGEFDAFSNERSVTDRYIWFFNRVLESISDEFPDKKLGFYVYHSYTRPPVKFKPDPRIVPALAPIALCRIHDFNNPICPEKSHQRELIKAWSAICPQVYDRGYWFNLADPGMPFFMTHRLRQEIPLAHDLGLDGWRVETVPAPAAQGPSLYVAVKLMWNHRADVNALLADYHARFFGPAAAPMSAYHELLDSTLRDADHHTGGASDMPRIFHQEFRRRARALIEQARALATAKPWDERVHAFDKGLQYLEHFVAMLESRQAHDFERSFAALQKLDAVARELTELKPPLLNPMATRDYMRRFFRVPTEQGYARTRDGNRVLVKLDEQWQFALDPSAVGQDMNWHAADVRGGNWQTINASRSWSEQGLRYYKGQAWYRQAFDLPADYQRSRVFIWFAGVDEKAMVYLNGRPLGISPGSAFQPFEMDATPAIQPGTNALTVRVVNAKVNELGTGGLIGPVMLYLPAKGDQATLENLRDLSPTFP